jgi:hypothetical protein
MLVAIWKTYGIGEFSLLTTQFRCEMRVKIYQHFMLTHACVALSLFKRLKFESQMRFQYSASSFTIPKGGKMLLRSAFFGIFDRNDTKRIALLYTPCILHFIAYYPD